MIEIYLLRHGETEYNAKRIFGGRSNHLHLTEAGIKQATERGEHFKSTNFKVDRIFCSSAIRAKESLENVMKIAKVSDGKITYHDELNEIAQGDWVGKNIDETLTPEMLKEIAKKAPNFKAPNGETLEEGSNRLYGFINENILTKYKDGKFLIVAHGLLFRSFVTKITEMNPAMIFKLQCGNLSLSKICYHEDYGWFMHFFNRTV